MQKFEAQSDLPQKISLLIRQHQKEAAAAGQCALPYDGSLGVADESGMTYEAKLINICKQTFLDDLSFLYAVTSLMKQRWHHLKHTRYSYVANPQAYENQLFINIAKFLVQLELLEHKHFYLLLMSSVDNFYLFSPLYQTAPIELDLTELFVSDDDYVIGVSELLDDFEKTGKCRCASPKGMRSLSSQEKARFIECVSAKEAARFKALCEIYSVRNPGLTKQTVEAVWRLACGITAEDGGVRYYNFIENKRAFRAVIEFQEYVDAMLTRERAILQKYLITRPENRGDVAQTFAQVWNRMTNKRNECIFTLGIYFHKMAYDFLRDPEHNNPSVICQDVLKWQKQWAKLEPDVLEFASPELYVNSPENLLARDQLVVLLEIIVSRDWDESSSNKTIPIGLRGEAKIPAIVFEAYQLIQNERREAFPNWEGVLYKIFKLFRNEAIQKKPFWGGVNNYNWYRFFLDDNYLKKLIKVHGQEESDEEAIGYNY